MAVLRVLLLILKIIGITLLVILGIVLFLLLVLLLAPVRYKGKFKKCEDPEPLLLADGTVSFLNPLVRFKIRFAEKKLTYTLRVFGFCLMNSEKKKEKVPKKAKGKQDKKAKQKKEKKSETTEPATLSEVTSETEPEDLKETNLLPEPVESVTDAEPGKESMGAVANAEAEVSEEETKKKESVFKKIKKVIDKIRAIPAKIKEKILGIRDTIKLLSEKKEAAIGFLTEERHVTAFGTLLQAVKKLLKHILPTRFKGKLVYGSGDPASTGKALAVLGVLYSVYGKGLSVQPDFEEKCLEADVFFKGRIRLGTVLVIALKAIFDKEVKRMYRNFKKLLKKLKQKAGDIDAAE